MNPPIYNSLLAKSSHLDGSLWDALIDHRDDVDLNTSAFEAASVGWWPVAEEVKAA